MNKKMLRGLQGILLAISILVLTDVAVTADRTDGAVYVQALGTESTQEMTESGPDFVKLESESSLAGDYINDEVVVPPLGSGTISQYGLLQNASLPTSYDAREQGLVTSAKVQSDNTCWAFSAVGMAESNLLKKQIALPSELSGEEAMDLSEYHLAYFFYHNPLNSAGNTVGDATTPLGDYLSVGGNHMFTTFALANWYGLAAESRITEDAFDNESASLSQYPNDVHMQQAYWINLSADVSNVKRMILESGAAAISMYYSSAYLQSENHAYYNYIYTSVNHAVMIVGWDDNYSRNNFRTAPETDGAWLAKNSYGDSFGGEGYFWISYQDRALTKASAKAFVFDFETADNYGNIYQYDGSAGAYMQSGASDTGYRVDSGASIANIYTVAKDTRLGGEKLQAVSFSLYAVETDYSIQVYRNANGMSHPTDGEPMLELPVTGHTSFVGYYTVPLTEEVILAAGDTFSVVVSLSNPNGAGTVSYFVDKSYTNGNWIQFTNATQEGQSYAYENGGWTDLSTSGATARIKAFTDEYQITAQKITVAAERENILVGDTLQMQITAEPMHALLPNLSWSSSNPAVAEVDQSGKVTTFRAGTTVITAVSTANAALVASCQLTVNQLEESSEEIESSESEVLEEEVSETETPEESSEEQETEQQPEETEISTDTEVIKIEAEITATGESASVTQTSQKRAPNTSDVSHAGRYMLLAAASFAVLLAGYSCRLKKK